MSRSLRDNMDRADRVTRSAWGRLRPLSGERIAPVVAFGAASVVCTSPGEAGVHALAVGPATAVVVGAYRLGASSGLLCSCTSLALILLSAFGVALLRMLLPMLVAWLPGITTAGLQIGLRRQLTDAYSVAS